MVRCVKCPLRKVLGNARLTHDELPTMLIEVEGTLNSRPLTCAYDKSRQRGSYPIALDRERRIKTILGKVIEDVEEGKSRYTRRFRYLSVRLAHFCNQWRREYLTDLREFHCSKVGRNAKTVEERDVVTVYNENKKRGEWRMALAESLIKGKDDIVKGANIRVIAKGKPSCVSSPVQILWIQRA